MSTNNQNNNATCTPTFLSLRVKRLRPTGGIVAPKQGNVGYDILSAEATTIEPYAHVSIPTGVALELPDGYMARVSSRSGFAFGKGALLPPGTDTISLDQASHVYAFHGTIDPSYRGEVRVLLMNFSPYRVVVPENARIAQLVIIRVELPPILDVTELSESERGERGFGSSGIW
jgi:dUTP pyrophosphatase